MTPPAASAPAGSSGQPAQPVPAPRFLARQRDPPVFAATDDLNVEDWLAQVDRVATHNNWDDNMRLANVVFYLASTALQWFENNESTLHTWDAFETAITAAFGKSEERKQEASRKLDMRHQGYQESFTSYMQDVLYLCRRVDPQMVESDKIHHLLKGLSDYLFNGVASQAFSSVTHLSQACRRLEDLRGRRICTPAPVMQIADPLRCPTHTGFDLESLLAIVRRVVREELAALGHNQRTDVAATPHSHRQNDDTTIRQVVQQEMHLAASALASPPRSYAEVCGSPPLSSPLPSHISTLPPEQVAATAPLLAQVQAQRTWEPVRDARPRTYYRPPPVCFYCHTPGHIARYCIRRQEDMRRERYATSPRAYNGQRFPPTYDSRFGPGWRQPPSGNSRFDTDDFGDAQDYDELPRKRLTRSPSPHPRRRSRSPLHQTTPKSFAPPN